MSIQLLAPTPIFIGVDEHHDLLKNGDESLFRAEVDTYFDFITARFPASRIVLLTSLEAGPSRTAAVRALARGLPYIAVVPDSADAPADALVPSAAAVIALEPGLSSGEYFALHCAVLMAFSDTPRPVAPDHDGLDSARLAPIFLEITDARPGDPAMGNSSAWIALDAIERWNARASGRYALDGTLCARSFEIADRFAVEHQRTTLVAIDWVYWLTLASTISLQTYDHLGEYAHAAIYVAQLFGLAFLGFIVSAIAIVARIHGSEVQSKFQDFRVLAEGLRVQAALLEEGIEVNAALRYRDDDSLDLLWIRRAIDAAYLAAKIGGGGAVGPRSHWVAEQRAYYDRAAKRNAAHAARANRIAVRWLRLSVATAVLIALNGVIHFVHHASLTRIDQITKTTLLISFALSGTFAGIVKGKSGLRAYGALATRYGKMFDIFDRAQRRGRDERTLIELADAALGESAAWHSSERSRPLESMWGGRPKR